jgi:hypothetical protein
MNPFKTIWLELKEAVKTVRTRKVKPVHVFQIKDKELTKTTLLKFLASGDCLANVITNERKVLITRSEAVRLISRIDILQ